MAGWPIRTCNGRTGIAGAHARALPVTPRNAVIALLLALLLFAATVHMHMMLTESTTTGRCVRGRRMAMAAAAVVQMLMIMFATVAANSADAVKVQPQFRTVETIVAHRHLVRQIQQT